MSVRHPALGTHVYPPPSDPSPDALTPQEVADVEDALFVGGTPRARLVRKMLRLTLRYQP